MPIPDPPPRDVEHLDEWANHVGGILDALLSSLPKSHRDHFESDRTLPNRSKKPITSEGRPLPEPIPFRDEYDDEPEPEPECSFCGGAGERVETIEDFAGFRTTIVLECPHEERSHDHRD